MKKKDDNDDKDYKGDKDISGYRLLAMGHKENDF